MVKITKLVVRSFSLDHLDLFWEISPVPGTEILDYEFYIQRSESVGGPFEEVGGPLRDTYRFRDIRVSLLHKFRQYFYKLRVKHVPTGKEEIFGPTASLDPAPDLITAEIVRQEDKLFREFVGRKCWLFPIRTFGPYCSCYDPYLGRMKVSNHGPCFGTGWLGGYMSPIEVWVQIDPVPKGEQETALQMTQNNNTSGRMISFPPVKAKDILVEAENRRWTIISSTPTQRLRATVRQELQLHEIPRGDVQYALPVKVDLQNLSPTAERNFTNPQSPDQDDDLSDILLSYGFPRGSLR